jgi:hypothetical protein
MFLCYTLYSYAFILDSRAMLNSFTKALQIMFGILSRDYSAYLKNVKIELAVLFSNYESKYGGSGYRGHHSLTME